MVGFFNADFIVKMEPEGKKKELSPAALSCDSQKGIPFVLATASYTGGALGGFLSHHSFDLVKRVITL